MMRALSFLAPILVFTCFNVLSITKADCIIATDADADIQAAGYDWQFVAELTKLPPDPRAQLDSPDIFVASRSYDGDLKLPAMNLSIRATVPRKTVAQVSQPFHLQNGNTVELMSGKQVYTTYRIGFWTVAMEDNRQGFSFLMQDAGECITSADAIGFVSDDLTRVAVNRLVKL